MREKRQKNSRNLYRARERAWSWYAEKESGVPEREREKGEGGRAREREYSEDLGRYMEGELYRSFFPFHNSGVDGDSNFHVPVIYFS